MTIKAEEIRTPIQLQSATNSQSASGEVTQTWTTYADTWSMCDALSGRELQRGKSFGETVSHKITIRYRTGVTSKHRALVSGKVYLINAVLNPMEEKERLEIFCTEIV